MLKESFLTTSILEQNPDLNYTVDNIFRQGSVYLSWLDLLDTNVVVIFILMSLVAISTLISSLFIQVLEKINTIGLLKALGAGNKLISRVFILISLRLVFYGIVIGNALGLGIIFTQYKWGMISLDPEMYYLNRVPIDVNFLSILILNVCVVIVCWLVLILPAQIATRMPAAKTLRFD